MEDHQDAAKAAKAKLDLDLDRALASAPSLGRHTEEQEQAACREALRVSLKGQKLRELKARGKEARFLLFFCDFQ